MTDLDIQKSFYLWFSQEYAGTTDWLQPYEFNPKAQTSWITIQIDDVREDPTRRDNRRCFDVRISGMAVSRSLEELYGAQTKASALKELLRHAVIPIVTMNSDESSQEIIGYLKLYEPNIFDLTQQSRGVEYQVKMVTVEGMAQETH